MNRYIKLTIFLTIVVIASCSPNNTEKVKTSVSENKNAQSILEANQNNFNENGQKVFNRMCVTCHGANGKLGIGGAKDLSISTLSFAERIDIISHGKGQMMPFDNQLSENDINAVAQYIESLRK